MKTRIFTLIFSIFLLMGCSSDENENKDFLTGTWSIAEAYGTEWEEGEGIVTPKAEDTEMTGRQLIIEGGSMTVTESGLPVMVLSIEYTSTTVTLTTLDDPVEVMEFTMKNKTATSVEWEQREPETHSDYTCNATCLYYQKFWKLEFPD